MDFVAVHTRNVACSAPYGAACPPLDVNVPHHTPNSLDGYGAGGQPFWSFEQLVGARWTQVGYNGFGAPRGEAAQGRLIGRFAVGDDLPPRPVRGHYRVTVEFYVQYGSNVFLKQDEVVTRTIEWTVGPRPRVDITVPSPRMRLMKSQILRATINPRPRDQLRVPGQTPPSVAVGAPDQWSARDLPLPGKDRRIPPGARRRDRRR